jgi:hypothetical protein
MRGEAPQGKVTNDVELEFGVSDEEIEMKFPIST